MSRVITRAFSADENVASLKHIEGFMRPIVKLMLAFRVSMPAFIGLIKKLFLEEGRRRMERTGQRVSVTGLAMAAGCDDLVLVAEFLKGRKTTVAQIGGLLERVDGQGEKAPAISVVAAVLERWRQDRLYLDADGKPVSLPIIGMAGRSFDGLVRRAWSGRMGYGPILDEMVARKLVKVSGEGEGLRAQLWETTDADGLKPAYTGDSSVPRSVVKIKIDGEERSIGQHREVSNEGELLPVVCRSLGRFASTVHDNVLLQSERTENSGVFMRTERACMARRLPAIDYWAVKALAYETFDQLARTWNHSIEQLELPITTAISTDFAPLTGIGFYFFDERSDPYDTTDIGMPEIIASGKEN